jgi:hypothetical protein
MKLLLFLCIILASCKETKKSPTPPLQDQTGASPDEIATRLVQTEEMVLKLTPHLKNLAQDLRSKNVPAERIPPAWRPYLAPNYTWLNASFGILSGGYEEKEFITKTKFEGLLKDEDGSLIGIQAKQDLTWGSPKESPSLINWSQLDFQSLASEQTLFQDVTTQAIPSSYSRDEAQRSKHYEITEQALTEKKLILPKREYAGVPDMESALQYPSVSVVDYDSDGHDDLLITARYLEPQLFRNLGNGTFRDTTLESGLTPGYCVNFILFADFDNDGDPDALVCRSLEPTLYFQNSGGRFENVTSRLSDLGKQFFVVSACATDVNRDGLLDVYLSTYTPGTDVNPSWMDYYLPPADKAHLNKLSQSSHPYFDDRGAANILLMNRGNGRLERAGGDVIKLWRKSYQPTWADFDNDGDDDLYICNDFSPDSYLRNDTPKGSPNPIFTEAFKETFPDGKMAFGMGTSLGDYDHDGDLDLFVSNMYSKAGNRIIKLVGEVDPRIKVSARGNFLYENNNGSFRQVAAPNADETRTGWSFGGQFADFNNDSHLDLYVPCGYYSAPKTVATNLDL